MTLSAALYLGMWLWFGFGWIACVLGQIGLAIAIAVYRALAEMGDADR